VKFFLLIILLFLCRFSFSQSAKDTSNGYVKYYYGNGALSSEGLMVNGKPEGYWKTYYVDGKLKSEGYRKNFQLDSVWTFYDESGVTEKIINYLYGKKNGHYYTFSIKNTDSTKAGVLLSKELYLDDQRQGFSYFYYSDGKIYRIIPYKDGKKDGIVKEFSRDSVIITLTEYRRDFYIDREKINRTDKKGRKQGVWKDFYPNDKVKTEANYMDGLLTGYYKEYDIAGKVIKEIKYDKGLEIIDTVSTEKIVQKNLYHENGIVKYNGAYRDSVPIGIHREYSESGEVVKAYEYNDFGKKTGEGIVDKTGLKQGKWRHFFEEGTIQAVGEYKNNRKTGEWSYFFPGGNVEQRGVYIHGKPDGVWKWFYNNGKLLREENFERGMEEGLFVEYSEDGKEITKGEYSEGEKLGSWFHDVGDYREEGNYKHGLQDGIWKWYYNNTGTLQFEGRFIEGEPDGMHKFYHENGMLKLAGKYIMGKKEGNWKRYSEQGVIEIEFTYKAGKEIRVDGMKWKWPDETKKK